MPITEEAEREELRRLRQLLEPGDGRVPLWGGRWDGGAFDQVEDRRLDHVAPVKDKDPPPLPPPEPEPKKIQADEEVVLSDAAWTVAPYYRKRDPEAPQYLDDMAGFYLEAARRLPIAQMPRLAGRLRRSAARCRPGAARRRQGASYVDIARRSRAALVVFMVIYFRHLTEAQAKRYLRAAHHDLVLAMGLVEWRRTGGFELPSPDCGRTKTALRYPTGAAMMLSDPDDLARLLASRFPRHLLDPVLDDLRRGEQLSVGCVNDIRNLIRHPWTPPPPLPAPTPGTFRDADGNVTIIANIGQDIFSTTTITRDRLAAFNNGSNNVVTTTTIWRHESRREDDDELVAATAYLSTDTSDTAESRVRAFLSTTTALQLQPDTKSLKMCLIDCIHGLYIQALAMLPSDHQPRLFRAMLAGGHCYGVMDPCPTSSSIPSGHSLHDSCRIILSNRTYHHPPREHEAVACLCKNHGNLMMTLTRSLNKHSLAAAAEATKHPLPAALVAFLTTLQTPEKRDRLCCLLTAKRALSDADFKELNTIIAGTDVAAAPVQRMATTPDPGQSAMNTVPAAETVRPFGAPTTFNLFQLAAVSPTVQSVTFPVMYQPSPFSFNTVPAAPAAPVQRMSPDRCLESYLCTKVEELLIDYGRSNPLGPQYKLGVICGVESRMYSSFRSDITCYHVNFLASTAAGDVPNDVTTSPPECKLFFTEFWSKADDELEPSKKPPVCFPIQNYHAFPGRCFICEGGSVKIVHPPCGNYFMGHGIATDALCAAEEGHADLGQ
ncbi:unnamed protein product [Alopecurus aequalis]